MTDGDRKVLTDLLACCRAWEPAVCVMGNVRAGDAAQALERVLSVQGTARSVTQQPLTDSPAN